MTPVQIRGALKKINVPVMTVVGSSEILLGDKTLSGSNSSRCVSLSNPRERSLNSDIRP